MKQSAEGALANRVDRNMSELRLLGSELEGSHGRDRHDGQDL